MKLTVVTATFNAIKSGNRENLIRCVRSVAALKTEHEHLIYDGASTDGTVELLRELEKEVNNSTTSHSSLLTIHSEKDTGIYNALNKGVRDAQGEWFYVLGCDDYICAPEVMDRYLEEDNSKFDVICSTTLWETEDGSTRPFFNRISDLRSVFWSAPTGHQGELIRTQWARAFGGFDEQYILAADGDMFFKAHYKGLKFSYRFEPFAFYSYGGASAPSSDLKKKKGYKSYVEAVASCIGLSEAEIAQLKKNSTLPTGKSLRFMFHRDMALRMGARFALLNKILNVARKTVRNLKNKWAFHKY